MINKLSRVALMLLIPALVLAQESGMIKGVVVDENDKPIAKAEVHIAEAKGLPRGHRIVSMFETNDEGRFLIPNVPWGRYTVLAGKPDAGYPDTRFAFYSNLHAPTVNLARPFPNADVVVKLPPKAGILELSPVTDASSGKAIDSPSVTLKRVQNPNFFIRLSATKRIPIPSDTDVEVEVSAPGYQSWPAAGDQNTRGRIRLKPDEVLTLDVQLTPE